MKITIAHLYPDLLNLYGDKGNIITLQHRMEQRGIETQVKQYELNDDIDFENTDILFLGGGSDREQQLVCERLRQFKKQIKQYAEDNGCILAVCGGYQLLGNYYKLMDETIPGIELLDIYTEQKEGRLIGNIVLESELINSTIVGFENHGGRTYIGSHTPLGKAVYGSGNNGDDM
ncbi:MAG: glutamine amidotransferase, partial [Clostridia bacterium]|nr:glutamine amidotransferase [Clostridia bacterium]